MYRFKSRLFVALLTFGIGVLGVSLWIIKSEVSYPSIKKIEATNKIGLVVVSKPVDSDNDNSENATVKETIVSAITVKGNFRVDYFEDNELFSCSFYRNGLVIKSTGFNTQTKKKDSESAYFYKNGEIVRVKINGVSHSVKVNGEFTDVGLEIDKGKRDLQFQDEFFESKNIEIPFLAVCGNEISDLTEVLSVADNYDDFKTEIIENGNQKTIKFIGFDKNIRLNHSTISMLIHLYGTEINFTIKDYALTLKDNYPSKEIYETSDGEIIREYSYKDGRLN